MSRFTKDFEAAHEVDVDLSALIRTVVSADLDDDGRRSAMACLLSGGSGWKHAAECLGGTFAGPLAGQTWLTAGKER
ncbi:hypothetical protein ABDK56_08065 [Sphingomonas sp. ASV193]|uniref:hypothetical protein n=1 Tax=Sphingomonas sp. ASV193 TaxID=3144405 RepID=UPI0032E85D12